MLFIVGYEFIKETSFSLDTGIFYHTATCHVIMFIMEYLHAGVISLGTANYDILGPSHYITINFIMNCE